MGVWGIILGRWGWLGVGGLGALFGVGGGGGGWLGKYFGWVKVDRGE